MAKLITLYSGSSGNSTLITDGGSALLVDMGQSCRRTLTSLYALGMAASDIDAILLTHEHTDHVSGLMTFLKHYKIPVFGAGRTLAYLRRNMLVPNNAELIETDGLDGFEVGAIKVRYFETSHDSEACLGYRFGFESGKSLALATDLGYVSEEVFDAMLGCEVVALESNYDETKLMTGKYPYFLKNRIRAVTGHLSNDACAAAAVRLAGGGTSRMVLMHLSRENNEPELALTTCLACLEDNGIRMEVCVAPRYDIGETIEV